MTPKEKAKELMLKYYKLTPMNTVSFAKQCALIAVDEMLEEIFDMAISTGSTYVNELFDYYEEVKQEIEKI